MKRKPFIIQGCIDAEHFCDRKKESRMLYSDWENVFLEMSLPYRVTTLPFEQVSPFERLWLVPRAGHNPDVPTAETEIASLTF